MEKVPALYWMLVLLYMLWLLFRGKTKTTELTLSLQIILKNRIYEERKYFHGKILGSP
jgi:hypothetical protein